MYTTPTPTPFQLTFSVRLSIQTFLKHGTIVTYSSAKPQILHTTSWQDHVTSLATKITIFNQVLGITVLVKAQPTWMTNLRQLSSLMVFNDFSFARWNTKIFSSLQGNTSTGLASTKLGYSSPCCWFKRWSGDWKPSVSRSLCCWIYRRFHRKS